MVPIVERVRDAPSPHSATSRTVRATGSRQQCQWLQVVALLDADAVRVGRVVTGSLWDADMQRHVGELRDEVVHLEAERAVAFDFYAEMGRGAEGERCRCQERASNITETLTN